jgi:hypothetical protein
MCLPRDVLVPLLGMKHVSQARRQKPCRATCLWQVGGSVFHGRCSTVSRRAGLHQLSCGCCPLQPPPYGTGLILFPFALAASRLASVPTVQQKRWSICGALASFICSDFLGPLKRGFQGLGTEALRGQSRRCCSTRPLTAGAVLRIQK